MSGTRVLVKLAGRAQAGLTLRTSFRAADLELPLIDGGAFDWVSRLSANRKHVFVASGLGSQLVAAMGPAGAPASR